MYQYIATEENPMIIDTSFCKSLADIKKEVISHSAECSHIRTSYPNGFVVDMITLADKIIFETNRKLIDCGNGKFTVSD